MGYPAIPLKHILHGTVIGWSVYACLAVVVVVARAVAAPRPV